MLELYKIAEQKSVAVYRRPIPASKGIAVPGAVCLDDGLTFDGAEERTVFAHELGHCLTGSFYTRSDPDFIRRRMENRADKWAIKKLVPKDELRAAIRNGRDIYELAEYFSVTEAMIRKALCWYQNGNLALEYCGIL